MKLSFSTLPCDGWTAEQLVAFCKEHGFAGVEVRVSEQGMVSTSTPPEERRRISELFRQSGVAITNIGSGVTLLGSPAKETETCLEQIKEYVLLAKDIRTRGVRIFLGNFTRRYDDRKEEIDYERIVACIREACDLASKHQVEIWIETHNEFATGQVLRQLLDDVDRPNCGIIWDIIHPIEDGETPEVTAAFLRDQCVHVHMKDGVPFDDPMMHDWKYTRMGEGRLPHRQIVQLLQQADYDGFYSLEWETKWREELRKPGMEPENILPLYVEYMHRLVQSQEGV